MRRTFLKTVMGATLIAASIMVMAPLATASVSEPSSAVGVAVNQPLPTNVASAQFKNQYGQPETLGALAGTTVLIVPILTLCGDTCPFTTGNLLQAQRLLQQNGQNNVELVAITVDPYRDTVKRLAAYAKMIGVPTNSNIQLWAPVGPTTTPHAPGMSKKSKGSGDVNANEAAVANFLGWSAKVVAQMKPVMVDWMTGKKLTYDINHSDGFWVMNANQVVSFASGNAPGFTGTIAKKLATFMGSKKNIYTTPQPAANGWTAAEAVQAIEWVAQGSN